MESPKDKSSPGVASTRSDAAGTAMADPGDRSRRAEKAVKANKMADRRDDGGKAGPARKRSAFDIYKRGQGYWVRVCTAVGAGIIILAGADFLYDELEVFRTSRVWTMWMQVGIPALMCVGLAYLVFWAAGVNRRSCDFMIATEGEMKKVSWSTRREIWGSTKVVIAFTLFLAFLLFAVDMLFWAFFAAIGVLQGPSPLRSLFGGS